MKSRASYGNVPGVVKGRGRQGTQRVGIPVYNETKQAIRTQVASRILRNYQERFVAARQPVWWGRRLITKLQKIVKNVLDKLHEMS